MSRNKKGYFSKSLIVYKKSFLIVLRTSKTKQSWRRLRSWKTSWKLKKRRNRTTGGKKKKRNKSCSTSKRATNLSTKRLIRWRLVLRRSKPSMLPTYRSLKIYRTSMKTKRSSYWILFESKRRKSKNSMPFWVYLWVSNKLITFLWIRSGTNKKKNGMCLTLHTSKKTWVFPSCPMDLLGKNQQMLTRRRRK